jgi:D-lyxose ketol-isomerase
MKRSEINAAYQRAKTCFEAGGWALPPTSKWDITDCGLNRFAEVGLVLVNLCEEAEYCEKLIYSEPGQVTPLHTHKRKKEDIICRRGSLSFELWTEIPSAEGQGKSASVQRNGTSFTFNNGESFTIQAGERITLPPGLYHSFWPASEDTIIGEVSTANDDANDNFFVDPNIGRFPEIIEDEPALIRLLSE